MIDVSADLHLHSKYSRAVSPQMNLENMAIVGLKKGLDLLATGDWTHPKWFEEIRSQLVENEEGLYKLKSSPVILSKSEESYVIKDPSAKPQDDKISNEEFKKDRSADL